MFAILEAKSHIVHCVYFKVNRSPHRQLIVRAQLKASHALLPTLLQISPALRFRTNK